MRFEESALVVTENSSYIFNETHVLRMVKEDKQEDGLYKLRKDGDWVRYYEIFELEIGKPMVLAIKIEDGVLTTRTTSSVEIIIDTAKKSEQEAIRTREPD